MSDDGKNTRIRLCNSLDFLPLGWFKLTMLSGSSLRRLSNFWKNSDPSATCSLSFRTCSAAFLSLESRAFTSTRVAFIWLWALFATWTSLPLLNLEVSLSISAETDSNCLFEPTSLSQNEIHLVDLADNLGKVILRNILIGIQIVEDRSDLLFSNT